MSTEDGMEVLAESTCWELLRATEVGRLAACAAGGPEIFPVNYVVDHGSLVFRTASGTKVETVREDPRVAFEIDGYDAGSGLAWSVVVHGAAHEVRTLVDAVATAELPLQPWHGSAKNTFLRIVPETLTGRRFPVTDAGTWQTVLTGSPHAGEE